jgi:hypothetical protein
LPQLIRDKPKYLEFRVLNEIYLKYLRKGGIYITRRADLPKETGIFPDGKPRMLFLIPSICSTIRTIKPFGEEHGHEL